MAAAVALVAAAASAGVTGVTSSAGASTVHHPAYNAVHHPVAHWCVDPATGERVRPGDEIRNDGHDFVCRGTRWGAGDGGSAAWVLVAYDHRSCR